MKTDTRFTITCPANKPSCFVVGDGHRLEGCRHLLELGFGVGDDFDVEKIIAGDGLNERLIHMQRTHAAFKIRAHDSRIRQALRMFFEGTSHVLMENGREAAIERVPGRFTVAVTGSPAASDFEITKIFKFYFTDALGNADLSLASARLIAETYGGELDALEDRDKVSIRLSFPGE
jgi:hypothetical protein